MRFVVVAIVLLVAACGGSTSPTATPEARATTGALPTSMATRVASLTSTAVPAVVEPTTAPAATETPAPASTVIVPPLAPSPPSSGSSGVSGAVLVGPTCPIQRIDSPCPDRPWQGVVVAQTTSGLEVTRADTDTSGAFSMQLTPGVYDIVTLTSSTLPAPVTQRVTVQAGAIAQIELMLDSGIR